jgi:hypothetical protein
MLGPLSGTGLARPESLDELTISLQASLTWEAAGGIAGAAGAVVVILIIRRVMDLTRR